MIKVIELLVVLVGLIYVLFVALKSSRIEHFHQIFTGIFPNESYAHKCSKIHGVLYTSTNHVRSSTRDFVLLAHTGCNRISFMRG